MLDDDLFARHGDGALGERHRGDHGQEFRGQADGQRNCKQQGLKRIAMADNANGDQKEHKEKDRSREQAADTPQATVEGCLFRPCG